MPDFSDSRKGRPRTVDESSPTRLSTQRRRPTGKDSKQPDLSKQQDPIASGESSSRPPARSDSSAPNTPRQSDPCKTREDGNSGTSDIERPEFVKAFLLNRGLDPLKQLPEKLERALQTEISRLGMLGVNRGGLPHHLRCTENTVLPPLYAGVPRCHYFAETDSLHVPAETGYGGAFDVPIAGEWWRHIKLGSFFWVKRKNELESLWATGKLANRDLDRWGRPWGAVHAGLGKEPRKWGRKESISIFELNSGGKRRNIVPFWREGVPGWSSRFRIEKLVALPEERLPIWLEIELRSWLKVERK